jgi:hypothetical protein
MLAALLHDANDKGSLGVAGVVGEVAEAVAPAHVPNADRNANAAKAHAATATRASATLAPNAGNDGAPPSSGLPVLLANALRGYAKPEPFGEASCGKLSMLLFLSHVKKYAAAQSTLPLLNVASLLRGTVREHFENVCACRELKVERKAQRNSCHGVKHAKL